MRLAARLAALALAPISSREQDRLRSLTLSNLAAGLGVLGNSDRLVWNLPRDNGEGSAAHRLAMLLHARTQDDFYPPGRSHVGVLALAPALTLAPAGEPADLWVALAAGYRVTCAVSAAYALIAQRRGFRPSSVFGPLGAAAAGAVTLGATSVEEIANAIALAASMAGGTNQSWIAGTDEWLLEVGAAARAGVEAARFASAGASAAPDGLEGTAGWAAAFFDDPGGHRLDLLLDAPPPLIDGVARKPYPVSGIAQVATELACRFHQSLQGEPADSIVLTVSEAEGTYPGSLNRGPFRSRSDALMSLSLCVACGMADGIVRLARLEDPNQAELAAIVRTIEVRLAPSLEETHATLAVSAARRTCEASASGSEILFPSWKEVTNELDALCRRTEADEVAVRSAAELVGAGALDARAISELMNYGHE